MAYLGHCALDAFNENLGAAFFSSAKNEMQERWSYLKAWHNAWINTTEVSGLPLEAPFGSPSQERPGALELDLLQ